MFWLLLLRSASNSAIVQAIDADDNGIYIYETKLDGMGFHTLSDIIESFVPRHVADDDNVQNGYFLAEADSPEGANKLAVIALE